MALLKNECTEITIIMGIRLPILVFQANRLDAMLSWLSTFLAGKIMTVAHVSKTDEIAYIQLTTHIASEAIMLRQYESEQHYKVYSERTLQQLREPFWEYESAERPPPLFRQHFLAAVDDQGVKNTWSTTN